MPKSRCRKWRGLPKSRCRKCNNGKLAIKTCRPEPQSIGVPYNHPMYKSKKNYLMILLIHFSITFAILTAPRSVKCIPSTVASTAT